MRHFTTYMALFLFLCSCQSDGVKNDRLVISVSILPQQYFIERIAGDLVEVNVMIPRGASPATYEPTVSQLTSLDQSAVYMKMGYLGFELSWMEKIEAVNPDMKIVDLSRGIETIVEVEEEGEHQDDHSHVGIDPHIWMSALNARTIARNVYNELVRQLPDDQKILDARLAEFESELDSLHATISNLLAGYSGRSFMIYHPALSYFARDYNLIQHPLEAGGKSPSPSHMKEMTDLGIRYNISTIFIQMQFDQRNARVLANEIGAKIVQIDPLDPDWYNQMLFIAKQLSSSL